MLMIAAVVTLCLQNSPSCVFARKDYETAEQCNAEIDQMTQHIANAVIHGYQLPLDTMLEIRMKKCVTKDEADAEQAKAKAASEASGELHQPTVPVEPSAPAAPPAAAPAAPETPAAPAAPAVDPWANQ